QKESTYTKEQGRARTFLSVSNFNQHVLIRGALGTVLWLQGFADQAHARFAECFQDNATSSDQFTRIPFLHDGGCRIHLMTGDLDAAGRSVTMLLDMATTYGFSQYVQAGNCWRGVLLIKQHDFAAGTAMLGRTLRACEETGWTSSFPEFLAAFAEGLYN